MNKPVLAATLRSLLTALREDLKPELVSAQAKLRADLIDMVLVRLAVEVEHDEASDEHTQALLALLGTLPGFQAAAHTDPFRAFSDALAGVDLSHSATRQQITAMVGAIASNEQAWRASVEQSVVDANSAAPTDKRSSTELAIAPDTFTAYLRQRFPDNATLTAQKVTTVPGGRSKGTILVDLIGDQGPQAIVVRRDFEASVTGTSVGYEYPIVCAAWEHGIPVPQPLWLENDTQAIGGRFIAFARVPGKAMGTLFSSDASPAFLREFAGALAKVHTLDIDQTGLAHQLNLGNEAHPVRAMVQQFRQRYRQSVPPTPLMDAAFTWLDLQMDSLGQSRCLVHGDAGLHNTMGDGDRLTALLDWELAHAGDPAEDLAYCKYLVERLMPWSEFMAAYRDHGGPAVSEERLRFFTVWRTLYLSILTGGARSMFDNGGDRDLRIAGIGLNTFPRQLRDLASDLAAFAH